MIDNDPFYSSLEAVRKNSVKTRIRESWELGPPKTVMTNASNPRSVTALLKAHNACEAAEQVALLVDPPKPTSFKVSIEDRYERMAKGLNMCPHELKALLEHEFGADNQLVFTILKKFLAAVKLSGEVDLGPVQQKLRENEEANQIRETSWKTKLAQVRKTNKEREKKVQAAEQAFRKAWGEILIDLIQKLDRNPKVDSLGEWDRWFVRAMAEINDVCHISANGTAKIDFEKAKQAERAVINRLPERAAELQKADYDERYFQWLTNAPEEDLNHQMWHIKDDQEREVIAAELCQRKGLEPVINSIGDVDWYATLNQARYDDCDELGDPYLNSYRPYKAYLRKKHYNW